MTESARDASPVFVRALLYGAPAFYFLVTVGVGVWMFLEDTFMFALTVGVAVVGAVAAYGLLRRSYRSAGYLPE